MLTGLITAWKDGGHILRMWIHLLEIQVTDYRSPEAGGRSQVQFVDPDTLTSLSPVKHHVQNITNLDRIV